MNTTQLIEDNLNLVYYTINKYYPTYRYDEDLKQVGMVGLCRAANAWDGVSSKFSTFACRCIINEIRKELRDCNRSVPHTSLDEQLSEFDVDYYNLLPSEEIDFLSNTQLDSFVAKLTPSEKYVVDALKSGLTQREIAKRTGVSHRRISKMVSVIKLKWRKFNEAN